MKQTILLCLLFTVISAGIKAQIPVSQWQQTSIPPGGSVWTFGAIGSHLFAGTSAGGVYYSSDNGTTWQQRNGTHNPNEMRVNCMASSGNDLYIGCGAASLLLGIVRKSSDLGLTWTDVSATNGYMHDIRSMIIIGNDIYIGILNGGGPYRSSLTNIGPNTWTSFDNGLLGMSGLPDKSIRSMAVLSNSLIVGTYGQGAFISPIGTASFSPISNGLNSTSDYIQALGVTGSTILAGNISGTPVLYRSVNSGSTWSQADNSLFNNMPVYAIYTAGTCIFVGTEGRSFGFVRQRCNLGRL